MIIKAISVSKGTWYKCSNGHPYVIGECGSALELANCFCGENIGG